MKYSIEIYRIDIENQSFQRIDTIETFKNLTYLNRKNNKGKAVFNLSVYDPKANSDNLIRFRNHICIKRYGEVVWFGPIVDIQRTYEGVDGTITINAETYLSHLEARYTDKLINYRNIAQSEILWDLINRTQSKPNGGLLIRRGTISTGTNRDRTYEHYEIASAIINMTNVIGGPDIELIPEVDQSGLVQGVRFDSYDKMVVIRDDLPPLRIGENLRSMIINTYDEIYNYAISEGAGSGDVISTEMSRESSMIAYTRREMLFPQKSVSLLSTLSENLRRRLDSVSSERFLLDVELYESKRPTVEDLKLGDVIYVDGSIERGGGFLSRIFSAEISGISVSIDANATEYINLDLIGYV